MTRDEIMDAFSGILDSCTFSDCKYSCPFKKICEENEAKTCRAVIEEVIARAERATE